MKYFSRPTLTMYFDRRGCAKGFFSVKWYVYFKEKQRMFSTGKIVTAEEAKFLKQYSAGLRGTVRDEDKRALWKEVYEDLKSTGEKAIEALGSAFSFDRFRELVNGDLTDEQAGALNDNVFDWFKAEIAALKEENRFGNSESMESAMRSFSRFVKSLSARQRISFRVGDSETLSFSSVTPEFLEEYEKWMYKKGKLGRLKKGHTQREETPASSTTVGIYSRALRTIYNKQKFTSVDQYPFTKKGFTIPQGKNIKKALEKTDIEKILRFNPSITVNQRGNDKIMSEKEEQKLFYRRRAHDLWVFSYLCNGLNFADILSISNKMLQGDQIRLLRKKTIRSTKGDAQEIVIHLLPKSLEILKRWENKSDRSPEASVWSFLSDVDISDSETMDKMTNYVVRSVNYHMKKIGKELEIEGDVRTYSARHSFATTLLRSEVPLAFISQALGHKSISTTQAYLGSFEDDQAKKYLSNLLFEE